VFRLSQLVSKGLHDRGFTDSGGTIYPDEQLVLFFVVKPGYNMVVYFDASIRMTSGGRGASGGIMRCTLDTVREK